MSRNRILTSTLLCGLVVLGGEARAQPPSDSGQGKEHGSVGLALAYPATGVSGGLIGLIWQTSDRIALRPEASITARIAGDSTITGPGHSWSLGTALTVLCYVGRREGVAAYVGPRFSFSGGQSNGGGGDTQTANYGVGVNGGLQYRLTKRIHVFGEVGLGYQYSTYSSTSSGGTYSEHSTSHGISSRTAFGLNLYF
jgi:opacity protein-like surface antigen